MTISGFTYIFFIHELNPQGLPSFCFFYSLNKFYLLSIYYWISCLLYSISSSIFSRLVILYVLLILLLYRTKTIKQLLFTMNSAPWKMGIIIPSTTLFYSLSSLPPSLIRLCFHFSLIPFMALLLTHQSQQLFEQKQENKKRVEQSIIDSSSIEDFVDTLEFVCFSHFSFICDSWWQLLLSTCKDLFQEYHTKFIFSLF